MGIILAILSLDGTVPDEMDLEKMCLRGLSMTGNICLRRKAETPDMSGVFLFSIERKHSIISSSMTGVSAILKEGWLGEGGWSMMGNVVG
jgi:hypothetical protein